MDDNGDVWISPAGIDKGSLNRKDIVCMKADGSVEGIHRPSSEYPFHKTVYARRPDLRAILHAHPPALVAFSIVRKIPEANLIPDVHEICGQVGIAEYGVPGSDELGAKIARVFAGGINTVLLENHGIVVGAENLFKAFMAFETLDFSARLEISAKRMGAIMPLGREQLALAAQKKQPSMPTYTASAPGSAERAARREMVELIHRAYDQRLVSSTQGTFSRRLDGDNFIITPFNLDRKYLESEDLVRVQGTKVEEGKNPSRSVLLHRRIYEKHPSVNSVIIAHPPSMMVFAVTDALFDSRTIPESYILLRNIPLLPFGIDFTDREKTADVFSAKTALAIIKNNCIIATGTTLLNAFDRLEVAEYSAKAILSAHSLGEIVKINGEQVAELEKVFHLEPS